jgi:hypothetical protein
MNSGGCPIRLQPGLKVLFSTGYKITDEKRAAFAERSSGKPYAPEEFVKALSRLLGQAVASPN